jgi:hypothetical protein
MSNFVFELDSAGVRELLQSPEMVSVISDMTAIVAGNAGAVELKINGKDSGKMGAKGQVAEKIYTPEGESSAADQSKKDSKK